MANEKPARGRRIGLQSVLVMLNFSRTDLDEPEDGVH
jgi:hypothetical protein